MRRLGALILGIVLALALAAAGQAQPARLGGEAGSLELRNGTGTVVLTFARGALIGSIERGRLRVTNGPAGEAEIVVWGADQVVPVDERTTIYRGSQLRYQISGLAWRVGIQGVRISGSVVGRGSVTLRGEAGTLSIDYGQFRRWPLEFRSVQLGALEEPAEDSGTIRG